MSTTADSLIETILEWGVEIIFGIPGDGINGIMEAIRKAQNDGKLRFIQARHEEAAALMACGYAKFTGKLGCCLATSGPGGIHLLNGLYDAKLDGAPVLAITGLQFHDLLGTFTQQDVALDKLFMDVATYNERVMGAAHVRNVAELACRTAISGRCVSHITIPVDIQDQELKKDERSKRNKPDHVSNITTRRLQLPTKSELEKAAEILNRGKRIAILAGQGAIGAGDELEYIADLLGAPIIKALLGKSCVPDDSPFTTGGIGLLGTEPSEDAMQNCDTLFIVGSSFPYIEFYPKPGEARAVQLDIDPTRIGLRYPVEVGLVGSAKGGLTALIPPAAAQEKPAVPGRSAGIDEGLARNHESACLQYGYADEAASHRTRIGAEVARRRHCDQRFGHDHQLVGAPHSGPARPAPLLLGQFSNHGLRFALCNRRAARLSGANRGGLRG
jgi:pyruvate dehydrogenase (quinone)